MHKALPCASLDSRSAPRAGGKKTLVSASRHAAHSCQSQRSVTGTGSWRDVGALLLFTTSTPFGLARDSLEDRIDAKPRQLENRTEVLAVDHSWQRAVREVLARHSGGLSLAEIAEKIGLSRANTWDALDELSRAGAVREYRQRRTTAGRTRYVSLWRLRDDGQTG